jgi:DNA-binding NarL/FixJ family response regulator
MTEAIRVVLVEDQRMFSDAVKLLLDAAEGIEWAGTAESREQTVQLCTETCPDVILLDVDLPGIDPVEATRRVRELCPEVRVVAITAADSDRLMAEVIEAGACGFVLKMQPADQLIDVVRRAAAGEIVLPAGAVADTLLRLREARQARTDAERLLGRLTEREVEILQALAQGNAEPEIAEALFISPHTVHSHVRSILAKLTVHSKLDAVLLALRHGAVRLHSNA